MSSVPARVRERLLSGLKRFQLILDSAKSRDVNESDTVIIVTDMLSEMFGFDKYSEITSEYAIRSTYVDLAIKLDGHVLLLVEVKAIGLELKDAFAKQAVDYAANQGVDWVVLTNGVHWHVYRVNFTKPIEQELVMEFNLASLGTKDDSDLDRLYMLTREGLEKALLAEYHAQRQVLSKYFIGAVLLTDPVLDVVRRELRRLAPDVRIDTDQIREVVAQDALKREILEGDKASEAQRKIARSASRVLRKTSKDEGVDVAEQAEGQEAGAGEPGDVPTDGHRV